MSRYQFFDPIDKKIFDALREDIQQNGVLVPIEVDDEGEILDGHHRADIARELGIECPRIVRHFDSEEEKREHIYKINLLRRHLDSAAWGKAFRELLKIREIRRGQGSRNDQTSANVAEVAREVGVPERTAWRRVAHSEAVEEFPELAPLPQSTALDAAKKLRAMPEPEREAARQRISEHLDYWDDWLKTSEATIDRKYKIAKRIRDAISAASLIGKTLDEPIALSLWLEVHGNDRITIDNTLDSLQRGIQNLTRIREFMESVLLEGGLSGEMGRR